MILFIFIVFVVSLVILYRIKYHYRNDLLAKFPQPKLVPIFNHALCFYGKSPKNLFDWLEDMNKKLGRVYVFTLDPFDDGTFVVSDPVVSEAILKSQKLLDKGFDYDLIKPWLGDGLLISTGEKWHQRRKILTPAFHFQILEKFVDIMSEQGEVLLDKLAEHDGKVVDVFPLVNLYSLDVICGEIISKTTKYKNNDDRFRVGDGM
jgi:cytochrome P450 family 4